MGKLILTAVSRLPETSKQLRKGGPRHNLLPTPTTVRAAPYTTPHSTQQRMFYRVDSLAQHQLYVPPTPEYILSTDPPATPSSSNTTTNPTPTLQQQLPQQTNEPTPVKYVYWTPNGWVHQLTTDFGNNWYRTITKIFPHRQPQL